MVTQPHGQACEEGVQSRSRGREEECGRVVGNVNPLPPFGLSSCDKEGRGRIEWSGWQIDVRVTDLTPPNLSPSHPRLPTVSLFHGE